ncbi:MAG: Hpt domain-containing protein [Desulfobulbaceae bacterium]|nr:Hpt domain-containing protein [Desulfobulbaceae bacterium]
MEDQAFKSCLDDNIENSVKPIAGNKLTPATPEMVRHHVSTVYQLAPEKIDDFLHNLGKSLGAYLNEAEAAAIHGNYTALAVTAHGLKGALLNLGLVECAAEARAIELGAKDNDGSQTFKSSLAVLREVLSPLMATAV